MVCPTDGKELHLVSNCVTEDSGEDDFIDDGWLEIYVIADFRVWQILLLAGTILTTIVMFLCCCIRFRIPRTKQEIESDWERREMAREFERRMKRIIGHEEGSKLDLRKALERVHADVVREEEEKLKKEREEEVKIGIRDGAEENDKDLKSNWRVNALEYGANNSLLGNKADEKETAATPGLGWRTTTMIARVFYNSTSDRRNN